VIAALVTGLGCFVVGLAVGIPGEDFALSVGGGLAAGAGLVIARDF
jgi:hypothetical protein